MELFVLAGGLGAGLAFAVGYGFARSVASLIALAAVGTMVTLAWHVFAPQTELATLTGNMNLLGWLAGTLLAARVRALEWLNGLDAQEAA